MKNSLCYFIILVIFVFFTFSCRQQTESEQGIDLSSVDAFFNAAGKISAGEIPTNKDWDELFATQGYSVYYTSEKGRIALRNAIMVAFDPSRHEVRDSILDWTPNQVYANSYNYTTRMCLENFINMQGSWEEMSEFRQTYDFGRIVPLGVKKLREFLVAPVDSIFRISTVSLACYEYDGHSREDNIILDFNLFFKQSEEDNIGFIAHEIFHSYRCMAQGDEYREWLYADPFLFAIDRFADEGTADLIDKPDDVPAYFRSKGFARSMIDRYEKAYPATPEFLEWLDGVAVSYADGKISEEEFRQSVTGIVVAGGHPNGLYMSRVIQKAGYGGDLIELDNLASPFRFLEIYNKAARKSGEYVFSDRFMEFLDFVEIKLPAVSRPILAV